MDSLNDMYTYADHLDDSIPSNETMSNFLSGIS